MNRQAQPEFELEAYLARVGLTHPPGADETGLRALHEAQFFTIPFENFDIQLGRGIGLAAKNLVNKLVHSRRGGYCFELNGLMLLAMRAVGFEARPLLARVHLGQGISGRSHQLALVDIGGRPWIIDVGFGAGGLRRPMPLEMGRIEVESGGAFRFVESAPWGIMMQSREKDIWQDSYSFDLSTVIDADIALGNQYTSTAPGNKFVIHRIASLPVAEGRVSLLDMTLTKIIAGQKSTWELEPGAAYGNELASTFGIELGVPYDQLQTLPA